MALGLRQLCSKFCQLFYSALPTKWSDNSLDLIRLFFQQSHYSTYYYLTHISSASFTQVRLRIRFYLTYVGTEICTVTGITKITTSASLRSAILSHPVTSSGHYLEKSCKVAYSPFSTVYSRIMPAFRNFLLFQKLCRHNCLKPKWLTSPL